MPTPIARARVAGAQRLRSRAQRNSVPRENHARMAPADILRGAELSERRQAIECRRVNPRLRYACSYANQKLVIHVGNQR
jgi:hypothetical protein